MLISLQVVEVVSGDCIIVADDAAPYGSPSAERRVNLSSIRAPKLGNARTDVKPEPFGRESKEFLRTRLIGKQVCRWGLVTIWLKFLIHHKQLFLVENRLSFTPFFHF